jgi:hypothetical protein
MAIFITESIHRMVKLGTIIIKEPAEVHKEEVVIDGR